MGKLPYYKASAFSASTPALAQVGADIKSIQALLYWSLLLFLSGLVELQAAMEVLLSPHGLVSTSSYCIATASLVPFGFVGD